MKGEKLMDSKKNERGQYGESLMSKYDIWYSDKENDNKPTRDTIKLYNHREYKSHCNCPEMTAWNLFGSKAVNFSNVAGNRGTVNSEWYKLKITEQNNKIDMHIIKDDEIVKSYTVLKLELTYLNSDPIEPMYILTLKRN
jgi:hypothetical protein